MAVHVPKISSMFRRSPCRLSSPIMIAKYYQRGLSTSAVQEKIANHTRMKLFVWGTSMDGQLGIGEEDDYHEYPTEVEGMRGRAL